MTSIELWHMCLLEATRISNATRLNGDGHAPFCIFSKSKALLNIKDEHTFGCPIFFLEPKLEQKQKIPKWNPRAKLLIHVGKCPFNAGNVSLVMNCCTCLIYLQFRLIFDDTFSTIWSIRPALNPLNWNHLCRTSSEFEPATDFVEATNW